MGIYMKNAIKYYYDIDADNIKNIQGQYKFYKNSAEYSLSLIDRKEEEISELYELINSLHLLGVPCHQIIPNKNQNLITNINNKKYVLLRKYVTISVPITINDIISFGEKTTYTWNYPTLNRTNWQEMWTNKLDYLEYQLSQIGVKYPQLTSIFGYYEGLTENAIQLLNMYSSFKDAPLCVSHKRIKLTTTLSDFYDPLNFIIDYKARDVSEYLKQRNLTIDVDIDMVHYLLDIFLKKKEDKILFTIRTLFPSFYFDVYEKVIDGIVKDDFLLFSENNKNYEQMVKKIYALVNTYIKLPNIEWFKEY